MNEGRIVQIIGPVVDIDFSGGKLPEILNAVRIPRNGSNGQPEDLIVEVQQHLGDNRVRTVFNLAGTYSGRFSSSEAFYWPHSTNLQNLLACYTPCMLREGGRADGKARIFAVN